MTKTIIQRKICILGDFAVGKTSLIRRFVEGVFDDRYLTTTGVKVSRRPVELTEEATVNLLIWDLADGEENTGVETSYIQGSSGALLVCDLTRPNTFDALEPYARRLQEVNPGSELVLVGNKIDLGGQRRIKDEMLVDLAGTLQAPWLITSAKTGDGVETAFTDLARRVWK